MDERKVEIPSKEAKSSGIQGLILTYSKACLLFCGVNEKPKALKSVAPRSLTWKKKCQFQATNMLFI